MPIRTVELNDIPALSQMIRANILALHVGTFPPKHTQIWIEDYSEDRLGEKIKTQQLFCLEEAGEMLGMVGLKGSEIVGLYVKPGTTGRGIGRQLIAHIEDVARQQGIVKLVLTSNYPTVPFYKRLEYVATGPKIVVVRGLEYTEMGFEKEL